MVKDVWIFCLKGWEERRRSTREMVEKTEDETRKRGQNRDRKTKAGGYRMGETTTHQPCFEPVIDASGSKLNVQWTFLGQNCGNQQHWPYVSIPFYWLLIIYALMTEMRWQNQWKINNPETHLLHLQSPHMEPLGRLNIWHLYRKFLYDFPVRRMQ